MLTVIRQKQTTNLNSQKRLNGKGITIPLLTESPKVLILRFKDLKDKLRQSDTEFTFVQIHKHMEFSLLQK